MMPAAKRAPAPQSGLDCGHRIPSLPSCATGEERASLPVQVTAQALAQAPAGRLAEIDRALGQLWRLLS